MRLSQVCICLLGIAAFGVGCDDDSPPIIGDPTHYASPSAPESLISNLQVSYRRREIEQYANLLAPEFLFRFQPIDQSTIGKESWTHDEDSVGTRALLTTPEVAVIRIDLLYAGRDSSMDKTPPADSVRIRIHTTDLEIDQTNDISWVATDEQDFFFRKGLPANGEDHARWFMYEWDDIPTLTSPRPLPTPASTWGNIKNRYSH